MQTESSVNKKIMERKKFTMGLFSGSLDKLTAAGVFLSGVIANDMIADIYVLLQGARAFKKEIGTDTGNLGMAENADLREEFVASLERLKVKPWLDFFREAKGMGEVRIHICGLAGKIWGGEKTEDFVDIVDDICGISEYINKATEADLHIFI
jgi:peroxiredoxin family protein